VTYLKLHLQQISDVFFPVNEKIASKHGIVGWDGDTAKSCFLFINKLWREKGWPDRATDDAVQKWYSGESMHPSGILIADIAVEKNIPIVMCTDNYHHQRSIEPVWLWLSDVEGTSIKLVDSSPPEFENPDEYEEYILSPSPSSSLLCSKKSWLRAIAELSARITHPEKAQHSSIRSIANKILSHLNS
jgi:hypothetical protein